MPNGVSRTAFFLLLSILGVLKGMQGYSQDWGDCLNTYDMPFDVNDERYDYGWSSALYSSHDAGNARDITSISIRMTTKKNPDPDNGDFEWKFKDCYIWMRHTTKKYYSDANSSDYPVSDYSNWTKVWDNGTMSFYDEGKTYTFDLNGTGGQDEFVYNGDDNIEVLIEHRNTDGDDKYDDDYLGFARDEQNGTSSPDDLVGKYGHSDLDWADAKSNVNRDYYKLMISELYNGDGTTCEATPLPIELIEFSAQWAGDVVKLAWETASETNNDYFTIERKAAGESWESIAKVDGAGDSNSSLHYGITDENPLKERGYYRLKQTDFNGENSYSGTRTVAPQETPADPVQIRSVPAEEAVYIEAKKGWGDLEIRIRTMTGRVVVPQIMQRSDRHRKIRTDRLPKGIYVIRVRGNGRVLRDKFAVR